MEKNSSIDIRDNKTIEKSIKVGAKPCHPKNFIGFLRKTKALEVFQYFKPSRA
uniref:Uncharacterized protein n=1 Tax=Clostridium novyi B str. ATCC 27606 TaxID=1443123 RepID=A0AA40M440_CLONO|nr:hypothetical protein Z959_p0089 [Clostridium novyi B str. ATCC 27606]